MFLPPEYLLDAIDALYERYFTFLRDLYPNVTSPLIVMSRVVETLTLAGRLRVRVRVLKLGWIPRGLVFYLHFLLMNTIVSASYKQCAQKPAPKITYRRTLSSIAEDCGISVRCPVGLRS